MNEFVRENLGKIVVSFFAIVVWPAIILILEWILFGRGIRGIKITGRWTGNPGKNVLYDFTAYLFSEQSEHEKSERDVIGLIDWKLVKCPPDWSRHLGARTYEIVKGTMTKSNDKRVEASVILDTLAVVDKILISPSRYTIKLIKRCCNRSRCEGTTTDTSQQPPVVNGDLQGSVKGRF